MFRNCQTTIILLALLSLLGQEASAQDDVAERALKLEREVLAYRESLVNIQAEISEKRGGRTTLKWKVWQKGDRIRFDRGWATRERPAIFVKDDKHVYCRRLVTRAADNSSRWGDIEVNPVDWDAGLVFDVRVLGIIPTSPISLYHRTLSADTVLGKTRLQRTAFEREILNGDEVVRIEMSSGESSSETIWIDETKGPSVVRVRYRAHYKGQLVEELMQVELQQVGDNWFPAQLATQRYTGGSPIPKEFVTISNVHLNEEIDDNLFDLEQLPPPTDR
ncbi:MAG: hypothetical protein KDA88_05335 [Planctomycetaceae bacterium]|nr:hypothetical protein [Planctomycetaceae bacterium]MCB9949723.1 hypothetical protein [Planctomycetaceae bacterium]